jgi:ATP-binding cassette subfamily B protein
MSLRYHLARRTGGLSRVIDRGVKGIENVVRFAMLNTIPTIIEFVIVGSIFLGLFGAQYLLALVVTIVAYVAFTVLASNRRIVIRRQMNDSDTDASSKAIDSLLNYETVKYFGNEGMEARRFDTAMAGYERAAIRIWTSLGFLNFGQALIFFAGTVVVMLMSASRVMAGDQTVGDFVLLNTFMMQIYRPLNFIGVVYREIRQGLTDIEAMFRLLNEAPEVADKPGAEPLKVQGGVVRFEDVHFAYDPDREILKGISFTVPAGKTVAVVGPSGAGKSTLARHLVGVLRPNAGSVRLDGAEITAWLEGRHIGYLPQDIELFADTVAANIARVQTGADAQIVAAAKLANVHDMIVRLPNGYDTYVGEGGAVLSGGFRQRVGLARAIFGDPSFVLLDEPSSNLDTEGDQALAECVAQLKRRGTTTIIVSHRAASLATVDKILILRDGAVEVFSDKAEFMRRLNRPATTALPSREEAPNATAQGAS